MATSRSAYAADADTADSTTTHTEKGISLARGPALILGTILTAAGLYFLYRAHTFPKFSNFPNGHAPADGKFFFGIFAANGWTGMFTAVAGALLLFGAAQHLLAKTMSLIVGLALGAAAVIAAISGNVLGMASANVWTEVGWGACAVILLFNTLIPRRRRTVVEDGAGAAAPVAPETGARRTRRTRTLDDDDVAAGQTAADEAPTREGRAARDVPVGEAPVAGDEAPTVASDQAPAVAGDEAPTVASDASPRGRRTAPVAPGDADDRPLASETDPTQSAPRDDSVTGAVDRDAVPQEGASDMPAPNSDMPRQNEGALGEPGADAPAETPSPETAPRDDPEAPAR